MRNDPLHAVMTTWAAKDLPGRISVADTAKALGFAEHDIQILMSSSKLKPLGDPAPNAPKWFAAIEIIQRATDQEWLSKATREVSKYWRTKRERSADGGSLRVVRRRQAGRNQAQKFHLNLHLKSGSRAMTGGEQVVSNAA